MPPATGWVVLIVVEGIYNCRWTMPSDRPANHLRASGRREICGGFFANSAPAHSAPTADGVTGAGFALMVGFLPDSPTGRTTEDSPRHPRIIPILTFDSFIHKHSVLFVWECVVGMCG